jgi:hypothetical protein
MSIARRELGDEDYQALNENWLTWAVLRHFLPTTTLRLLSSVIVHRVAGPDLSLSDLFEEEVVRSEIGRHLDSWLLRRRAGEGDNKQHEYLRNRIRNWAMHSDSEAFTGEDSNSQAAQVSPANALEAACQLGNLDFTSLQGQRLKFEDHGDHAIKELESVLSAGCLNSPEAALQDFNGRFSNIGRPLNAAIAKHIGDLYTDIDDWNCARQFYDMATTLLGQGEGGALADVEEALRDLTLQSSASAGWTQVGPDRATEILGPSTDEGTLVDHPILKLNAVYDLTHARMLQANTLVFPPDFRGVLMPPPQLASSFNLGLALSYSVEKNFSSASRHFWSVLRRQQALGLTGETKGSKFCYGLSLLNELQGMSESQRSPQQFGLAVRLLVESEEVSGIEKMTWAPEVVRRFLDVRLVSAVQDRADRYPGVRTARNRTAMELYRHWIEHADATAQNATQMMLEIIVNHAASSSISFFGNRDLGTRAFEILEDLAARGLGVNTLTARQFAKAFTTRMAGPGDWNAKRHAMAAAPKFMDAMDDRDRVSIIEAALAHLGQVNPATNAWHIVRPALGLLVSRASVRLVSENADIGERVLATILKFGTDQGTENSGLLFYLQELDPKLLGDPRIIAAARPALEKVRDLLKQNSSAAAHNIQSIFLAPPISGRDLLSDAVSALRHVIASVPGRNASLSFPVAYSAVMQLVQQKPTLATVSGVSAEQISEWFEGLFSDVTLMWRRAKADAMTFGSFAIPVPSAPSQAIVHNWAFASMRLAEAVGRISEMKAAVEEARSQPLLKGGIELGIAVSEVSPDRSDFTPRDDESREVFYGILGRRLVGIRGLQPEKAGALYFELLMSCFRHGPDARDAAIIVAALEREIKDVSRDESVRRYVARVEATPELRLILLPLMDALLPRILSPSS